MRRPAARDPVRRLLAADRRQLLGRAKKAHGLAIGKEMLGDRRARDHADDKKPVLAAALETAFDPDKSSACIGLGQTSRDSAAAWLPPGMAYGDRVEADASADHPDQPNGSARTGDEDEPVNSDIASTDLPAFSPKTGRSHSAQRG